MITYDMIMDAQETLVNNWKDDGKKVIEICHTINPFNKSIDDFLNHCTACGGNWGGMLLTGIKKLYPDVYDAIPDDMGINVWICIISTLILCGVDTRGEN